MPVNTSSEHQTLHQARSRDIATLIIIVLSIIGIGYAMYEMELLPFQETSSAAPNNVTAWATKVESGTKIGTNQAGKAYTPPAGRENPSYALGVATFEPENPKDPNIAKNKFISMGYGGELVYSFGKVVENVNGFDLTIHEATVGDRNAVPEDKVEIEVSQDRSNWKKIGIASSKSNEGGEGIKRLDFNSTGFPWIGYIKIKDISDRSLGKSYDDGFDLDAIGVVKLGTQATPAGVSAVGVIDSSKTSCTNSSKTSSQLNIVTYNMGDDGKVWKGTKEERIKALAKMLLTERNAEIIAIEEIKHKTSDGSTPEVGYLSKYFPGYHIYNKPHNPDQDYSNVILSKHAIVSGSDKTQVLLVNGGGTPRTNLSVIVDTPKGKVRVYAIHTRAGDSAEPQSKDTFTWVQQVSGSENVPYIVMGDFNQSRETLDKILSNLKLTMTGSNVNSSIIDHVYVSPTLSIKEKCVLSNNGISQGHSPVYITTN